MSNGNSNPNGNGRPLVDVPFHSPLARLQIALINTVNASGLPHNEYLGALLSVYRMAAMQHPCCVGQCAMHTANLAGDLLRAAEATSRASGNPHQLN